MHIFPASFGGHMTGRSSNHIIKVDVDSANSELVKDLAMYPAGKNIVVIVYDIEEGDAEFKNAMQDSNAGRNILMKRLNATIKDYATEAEVEVDIVKTVLKIKLKARGILTASFSKYSESELATAIYLLDTVLEPSKFDYSEYSS